MKIIVDRIENSRAVLVPLEGEAGSFSVPLALVPDIREGDVPDSTITRNNRATREIRDRQPERSHNSDRKNVRRDRYQGSGFVSCENRNFFWLLFIQPNLFFRNV